MILLCLIDNVNNEDNELDDKSELEGSMMKWMILFGYIIIFVTLFFYREELLVWLQNNNHYDLPIMIGLSILVSTIPVIPYTLFVCIMGLKFGVFVGIVISWIGGIVAALIYYFFSKYMLSNKLENYLNQFHFLHTFHHLILKNAFLGIFIGRLFPMFPPIVIHLYSGLIPISLMTYLLATALGKLPYLLLITFSSVHLFSSIENVCIFIFIYLTILITTFKLYKHWTKKHLVA